MRPVFAKTVKRLAPPLFLIPFSKNSGGNWLPECGESLFQVSTLKSHLWYLNLTQSSRNLTSFTLNVKDFIDIMLELGPSCQCSSLQKKRSESACWHLTVTIHLPRWDKECECGILRTKATFFWLCCRGFVKISGLGRVCRLWFAAAAAVAASTASRLGGEGGQPGTHLLCQPQQPLHAVETALQHVCLLLSALPSVFQPRQWLKL